MSQKYNTHSYFIGILNFKKGDQNYPFFKNFHDLDLQEPETVEEKQINEAIRNGAINVPKDPQIVSKTDSIFTIFYQLGNENYLCLHNNQIYQYDQVKIDLQPIFRFLPKIDYTIPKFLTIKQALSIFQQLFHKSKTLFCKNASHPIENFKVGKLTLHTYEQKVGKDACGLFPQYNIASRFLLEKNGAKEKEPYTFSKSHKTQHYTDYTCLFYTDPSFPKEKLLNLLNNLLYRLSDSIYYDEPLSEYLKEEELPNKLTVSKAKILFSKKKIK